MTNNYSRNTKRIGAAAVLSAALAFGSIGVVVARNHHTIAPPANAMQVLEIDRLRYERAPCSAASYYESNCPHDVSSLVPINPNRFKDFNYEYSDKELVEIRAGLPWSERDAAAKYSSDIFKQKAQYGREINNIFEFAFFGAMAAGLLSGIYSDRRLK